MHHPSGIDPKIVAKVVARRGRLHAFEAIDPSQTALVVIDLMQASIDNDPTCISLAAPIRVVCEALRRRGGAVAWVTASSQCANTSIMRAIHGEARHRGFAEAAREGDPRSNPWPELTPAKEDIQVTKRGYSAFFPGHCELHAQLQRRGVDTLLIAGTVTNVCCESSVRDAVELGYKVIMISDANIGHARGLHEASLATIYRCFGDVRPAAEVIGLIDAGGPKAA